MTRRNQLRKSRSYLMAKRDDARRACAERGFLAPDIADGIYCRSYAPKHVQRVMRGEDPVWPKLISNSTGRPV